MSNRNAEGARAKLRVGSVPYIVGRPLDMGLEREPGIELERDVPASLVQRLRDGQLDVALVSSIELFRRPGYRYLSDIAVSGRGSVASVQVFLRKPLHEVRKIALDPSSRTAATLVRVLLGDRERLPEGVREPCEFLEVDAGLDPREAPADAWLRIGDAALREVLAEDAPSTFNPSAAWTERTGLPFIFALWIVRPEVDLRPHLPAFARARARGAESLEELAARASREWGLPLEACRRYLLEECRYDPGSELEHALLAFRDAAAPLDLCRADLLPQPISGAASRAI